MKSQVVLLECGKYDREKIYEELLWGIGQLGGVGRFVQPEEKILLKPNLLRKAEADSAIVTHPMVVAAAARIFRNAGYEHIFMEIRRASALWRRFRRPVACPQRWSD